MFCGSNNIVYKSPNGNLDITRLTCQRPQVWSKLALSGDRVQEWILIIARRNTCKHCGLRHTELGWFFFRLSHQGLQQWIILFHFLLSPASFPVTAQPSYYPTTSPIFLLGLPGSSIRCTNFKFFHLNLSSLTLTQNRPNFAVPLGKYFLS